jgi:protein O-GlcNAc transferase
MQQTHPSPSDMCALQGLYDSGRFSEAEARANSLLLSYPESAPVWKLLALSIQRRRGNALQPLRRAADLDPADAEVRHWLGLAQARLGLLVDAAESFRLALKIRPDFAEAHVGLGNVLKELGHLYDATMSYRQALRLRPDYAEAHSRLSSALQDLGELNAALESCRKALALDPALAEAHCIEGSVLQALGHPSEAVKSYREALRFRPEYAEAHCGLGSALRDLGELDAALENCRQALALDANLAEAYINLGAVLQGLGKLDEAITSLRRAVEIKPNSYAAQRSLGDVLEQAGQHEEAKACYRRGLQQRHVLAEEYNRQGASQLERRQIEGAVALFRLALSVNPDYARGYANLGNALRELGQLDASRDSYLRAARLQPEALHHAINASLLLPVIPASQADIAQSRERYRTGITHLMETAGTLHEPGEKLNSVSFYLAYHNADDRPLMESLCRLFRARAADLTFTAPHVPRWPLPSDRGQRIRVGFLSEYLYDHTIGKHYQGFIRHLDRERFEVVVIHGHRAKRDAFRQNLDALADKSLALPASLKSQQHAVANEQLDVLFYPDIGMSAPTYFLAYARLAPVQATSWGHPDTSGLDTIDYYVSAVSNEPQDADALYTERLVRLTRLPCFYYQTQASGVPKLAKAALGLPERGILYGCPQSLFKIHPDFDAVLAEVATGDAEGHLIVPDGKYPAWNDMLKARWAKTFPILLERVRFLPRMPWGPFLAVMEHTDVLLDPLHFGSGNTMYDAMINGTPVVTWPGRFARGRNVAAAYRQMGVADAPVAGCVEDYAPLALALGRNRDRRHALREASFQSAKKELFEDMQAVREFEQFLEAAVASAARGLRLPPAWRPSGMSAQD